MQKDRKIGSVFSFNQQKIKVVEVETDYCYNCYFAGMRCSKMGLGNCSSYYRLDKKNVVFFFAFKKLFIKYEKQLLTNRRCKCRI